MALRRLANRRFTAAIQQTKITRTLEQAEKVLGRIVRFVDAQHATLVDPAEQPLHALQHALWPGLEENLRELRVLAAQGHHQSVQVHRLVAVDQLMKPACDIQQHCFHRHAFRQLKEQGRQLLLALGHHGGGEQCFLVVEVAVDRQLRHAGLRCHGVHAGAGVALAQKQRFRGIEDRPAFGQILGAAWAVGC